VDEWKSRKTNENTSAQVIRGEMHGICLINGEEVEFLADTGAAVSAMSASVVEKTRTEINKQCALNLIGPNGSQLQLLGEAQVNVRIGRDEGVVSIPVVSNLKKSLLVGRDIMSTWHTFKSAYEYLEEAVKNASNKIKETIKQRLEINVIEVRGDKEIKYQEDCEESLKKAREFIQCICEKIAVSKLSDLKQATKVYHVIKVTNETPIRQKPRPIPYHLHEELRTMLKEMLDAGIIGRSDSP
jgi:hypothetical protein